MIGGAVKNSVGIFYEVFDRSEIKFQTISPQGLGLLRIPGHREHPNRLMLE